MLGFMSTTAILSMGISNIASTAIMLPIVRAMMEHLSKTEAEVEVRELQQSREMGILQVQESKDGICNIRM